MTDPTPSRRDELIAAALADDLSPAEAAEFAALRAEDPGVDAELAELAALTARLADLPEPDGRAGGAGWVDLEPSAELRRRVAGIAGADAPAVDADADADAVDNGAVAVSPRADAPVTRDAPVAPVTLSLIHI
ncbi:hypothetical protein FRIG_06920 [Frigoribacterium faeni]|uniref:hypothetical protein n=1 Tax=Frigoribacterium faeni TaxID=145483 RepID=UPI001FABF7AA|nr:hypothetical protein [Frigoribacterium faeni]MCJ0700865.1 hypothetical protein [Frigoribacterium faeni]